MTEKLLTGTLSLNTTNQQPEKYNDYEFWSLLDPRWPELHNRVYMYFENVTVVSPDLSGFKIKHTNAYPKVNQMYFNSLLTDSIFKLQPCLTPAGLLACQIGTDAWITKYELGNEQRRHRSGSEKNGILVENGR